METTGYTRKRLLNLLRFSEFVPRNMPAGGVAVPPGCHVQPATPYCADIEVLQLSPGEAWPCERINNGAGSHHSWTYVNRCRRALALLCEQVLMVEVIVREPNERRFPTVLQVGMNIVVWCVDNIGFNTRVEVSFCGREGQVRGAGWIPEKRVFIGEEVAYDYHRHLTPPVFCVVSDRKPLPLAILSRVSAGEERVGSAPPDELPSHLGAVNYFCIYRKIVIGPEIWVVGVDNVATQWIHDFPTL